MNKRSYKLIFSRRHNKIIAVGENASSISHSGARNHSKRGVVSHISYVARLSVCSFAALIALDGYGSAFAAPAVNALPTGASVAAGNVAIAQTANNMTVTQTTDKAIVNWNSFNIGAQAAVNIVQPSASSMHLSRVTGTNASQIFGQLTSNGQVVLVNPNGIVFGKDGSVSASSFTASTLGITDANFMAGKFQYARGDAAGSIVNDGKITATGGYVALLGAQVSNAGTITAPKGTVYLGAAQAITVPVSSSGKIKLELSPAAINTSVANTETGIIVAEGGQVYLQAASLNDAAATAMSSVKNAGSIDVSAAQAGDVTLLTDGGNIKVSGSILANSTNPNNAGGNIIIGRDLQTGVLSATSDVSGATLQAKGGFIETSGEYLKTDGVKITAKDWLIDPNNVEINLTATPVTAGNSVVRAGDISTALGLGTSVTIATGSGTGSTSSATGSGGTGTISQATVGTGNTSDGNILVNSAINNSYTGSTDIPTLTLLANNGITVGANIGTSGSNLNVTMTANGLGTTSQGIILNNAINAGTGTVSLTGTSSSNNGIYIGSQITSSGDVSLTGKTSSISTVAGVRVFGTTVTGKNITVKADSTGTTGSALGYWGGNGPSLIATEQLKITGTSLSNGTGNGVYQFGGRLSSGTGMIITGTSQANNSAVGLVNNMTITNGSSGGISITGTAKDGQPAIQVQGSMTNGGGDVVLSALKGYVALNGTLTNASTGGAVKIQAGNGTVTDSGAIDGTSLTINQNSNGGVQVLTSGTGNVVPPRINNNGNGDVVIAAGSGFTVGNGLSVNIVATTTGLPGVLNPVVNNGSGKVYLYSGTSRVAGNLSALSAGSNTQVMFRDATTAPNIPVTPAPLPPNVNPVSPTVVPSSTQSAGLGVSFGPASIDESGVCGTKRSCNCDATDIAGVEICYSVDPDSAKPKIQISKLVGGKW